MQRCTVEAEHECPCDLVAAGGHPRPQR
jgi:hypothetical protein